MTFPKIKRVEVNGDAVVVGVAFGEWSAVISGPLDGVDGDEPGRILGDEFADRVAKTVRYRVESRDDGPTTKYDTGDALADGGGGSGVD